MPDQSPYPDHLRDQYDRELLDVNLRRSNANRLHRAFRLAGLWQDGIRILDVGSGSGNLLSGLGNNVAFRVACDLRRSIFLRARDQLKNVLFAQSDACALPFPDNHFQLVMCLAVIEEIADWQMAFQEMSRCVAPGGFLYVTLVNGRWLKKVYSTAETLGFRIREDWWLYAKRADANLNTAKPEEGMGLLDMSCWQFFDLTPFLLQSHWPWIRLIPVSLTGWLTRRISPSYGFVWQKLKA